MVYLIKLNNDLLEPKHYYPNYISMDSFPNEYIIGESDSELKEYKTWELDDSLLEGSKYFHIPNGKKLPYNPLTGEMAINRDKENRIEIVYSPEQILLKNKFKKFIYKLYIDDITESRIMFIKNSLFSNSYEFDLFNNINNGMSDDLLNSEASLRSISSEELLTIVKERISLYTENSSLVFNEKSTLLKKLLDLSDDETEVSNFLNENNLIYR